MSNDNDLSGAVIEELRWEPSVTAGHIGVTANAGVITLSGHVETLAQKHAAEAAGRRVKGVKAVVQEIEVRLGSDARRGDEAIAAAAIERLAWDDSIPRDAVKVKVEKGWVTLSGQVEWQYLREAAELVVRYLSGVVGVSNEISLRSTVDTADLGKAIMHALHRSWFFDPTVAVSAEGGKVRLTGTVRSPQERQVAANTAWAAPGATSVDNQIAII